MTGARVTGFSDGVIAIAITVMVLELRIPAAVTGQICWLGSRYF
jgi:uncharacterized membrane protein